MRLEKRFYASQTGEPRSSLNTFGFGLGRDKSGGLRAMMDLVLMDFKGLQ